MGIVRNRGFTLLETVAAVVIVGVAFGFLVGLLTSLIKNYGYTERLWDNFKKLDYGYKSGTLYGIKGRTAKWGDLKVIVYTYGGITYYEVLP